MENNILKNSKPMPIIKIFGIGNSGCKIINQMIKSNINKIEYCAINTDLECLKESLTSEKIHISNTILNTPFEDINCEVIKQIKESLKDVSIAFITCGMGGKIGTVLAPVVAKIAKEEKVKVAGIFSTPFESEKKECIDFSILGLNNFKTYCDTIITISSDKTLQKLKSNSTTSDVIYEINTTIIKTIDCIKKIIDPNSIIAIDFNDVQQVISNHECFIGTGSQTGSNRGLEATLQAIKSPLIEFDISKASNAILHVSAPKDFTMLEFEEICNEVRRCSSPDINLIVGISYKQDDTENVDVTLIASHEEYIHESVTYEDDSKVPNWLKKE